MKISIDFEYVIKRIVVIVLAFIIISQLKSCNVQALTYNTTLSPTDNFTNVRIRNSGSNKSGTKDTSTNIGTPTINWSWTNLTVVNSEYNTFQFTFANSYPLFSSYNNFVFYIWTENMLISGPVSTYAFNGVCETSSISNTYNSFDEVPSTSYPRDAYGLYGYRVHCSYSSLSGTSRFDFPIQLLNYSTQRVFISTYWTAWAESNDTENASNRAHSDSVNTQNKIDEVNDSINDTNISNDTNSNASDIFDIDIDTGHGLTAIITAPLSFLSHTQDTCTSKSFTLFGKSITLPCGTSLFWARDFSSYNSIFNSGLTGSGLNTARDNFRLFWNLLFGGAIVFHLLLKLWEQINLALDPMSDSFQSISSAIDTGRPVRDEDELAPRPVVKLHGLQAKNVDSYLSSKEV